MKESRRDFVKKAAILSAGALIACTPAKNIITEEEATVEKEKDSTPVNPAVFTLPALPYAADALEPFIDKMTMEIHHGKHHQAYVSNLNKALAELNVKEGTSIEEILKDVSKLNTAVRNNAGGHYNHLHFWSWMAPKNEMMTVPGKVSDAINASFGSMEKFREKFNEAAMKRFGSGWAWLAEKDGKLEIGSTPNQDNPLMDVSEFKGKPILGLDVWEHAYYLKYQNKRVEYINGWWNVVNWEKVSSMMS
jgi:superoxide dismutase, Fe-Mn family